MKKTTIYLSLAVLLAACGSSDSNTNIAKLQKQKDSLKTIYDDISDQIAAIDEKLMALDTNLKLPLVTVGSIEKKSFEHYVELQGAVEGGGNALV